MTKEEFITQFKETAATLVNEKIVSPSGCLSALFEDTFFITSKEAILSSLNDQMISEINVKSLDPQNLNPPAPEYRLHAALYQTRPDIKAIIHSTQISCLTASKVGETIPPILDDMAQIAGITVNSIDCPNNATPKELNALIKGMKSRNAILLKNQGVLCASSNLGEAHAVAMVMEKACKAFIESHYLGGAVVIPKIEALLMRFVYLKKYSKKQASNK